MPLMLIFAQELCHFYNNKCLEYNLSSFCSRLLPFVPVFGPRVKSETCLLLVLSHFYFHQNSLVATVRLLSFLDYLCVYTICCLPCFCIEK